MGETLRSAVLRLKAISNEVQIDEGDAGKLLLAAALFRKAFNLAEDAERDAEKLADEVIERTIFGGPR